MKDLPTTESFGDALQVAIRTLIDNRFEAVIRDLDSLVVDDGCEFVRLIRVAESESPERFLRLVQKVLSGRADTHLYCRCEDLECAGCPGGAE
jgi:hypothetical protein